MTLKFTPAWDRINALGKPRSRHHAGCGEQNIKL